MRGKVWKDTVAVVAVIVLVALSGCGVSSSVAPEDNNETDDLYIYGENGDLIVVGFSQIGSESVWRTANTESVESTFTKENGYFLLTDNARQRQENQIKAIRSYISQRVDYIVFSPMTEDGWNNVLEDAKEAGIEVILIDRRANVDESLYTTWVGSDMKREGEKAAEWLEKDLRAKDILYDTVNIVILQGTPGSSSELGRTAGFEAIASKYKNWHILDRETGDFTTAKGKEVMRKMLRQYPQIDVVVSQNDDMTFGAIEAIEEAGLTTGVNGDITIISFDAVRGALELVEEGRINVDIECNPNQGTYVEEVIQKLERGEQVEKAYVVEEKVFTKENVSAYIEDRNY